MSERRFTDQEVALVLRRASALESEAAQTSAARGLSLEDLEQIARDVGIAPDHLRRAIAEVESAGPPGLVGLVRAPGVAKAIQAVPGTLDRETMLDLMRVVDDTTNLQGSVSEALGEVRWTGRDRFRSVQVAFSPGPEETVIRVEERATPRQRRAAIMAPVAAGVMLVLGLADALGLGGVGTTGLVAAGALGFAGLGQAVRVAMYRLRRTRVAALLDRLIARAGAD